MYEAQFLCCFCQLASQFFRMIRKVFNPLSHSRRFKQRKNVYDFIVCRFFCLSHYDIITQFVTSFLVTLSTSIITFHFANHKLQLISFMFPSDHSPSEADPAFVIRGGPNSEHFLSNLQETTQKRQVFSNYSVSYS